MQQRTRHLDLCPLFGSTSKNTESYLAIASHPKNMVYGQILGKAQTTLIALSGSFSQSSQIISSATENTTENDFPTEIRAYMQIFQMFKISNSLLSHCHKSLPIWVFFGVSCSTLRMHQKRSSSERQWLPFCIFYFSLCNKFVPTQVPCVNGDKSKPIYVVSL